MDGPGAGSGRSAALAASSTAIRRFRSAMRAAWSTGDLSSVAVGRPGALAGLVAIDRGAQVASADGGLLGSGHLDHVALAVDARIRHRSGDHNPGHGVDLLQFASAAWPMASVSAQARTFPAPIAE